MHPTSSHGLLPAFPPERDISALADARVAVMITAFRIGPVLTDTILSALAQQHIRPVAVLLVIDGCPETETTHAITERYLAAYPELFHVLWLQNGGVSRARNRGLQWLLECHPQLEAIYCLDGDDLISTTSVASGLLALRDARARHPDRRVGWVVTNKLNFGDNHQYIETPEGFRRTSYLSVNLSQPSCLYNADMFREGLRWDESMRSGIEDWEFWLEAIRGDFEGVFNPRDLLFYRRLTGNRSSVNRRNDAYNIPYMRQKHAELFVPQAVLADEQMTAPRFAIGPPDARAFELTSDPGKTGRMLMLHEARNALGARLQREAPEDYVFDPYAPDMFVVIGDGLRASLQQQGLLRGLLMAAARLLSGDAAILEGVIAPMSDAQRAEAGPQGACLIHWQDLPRQQDRAAAQRSFFVIRPGRLAEPGDGGDAPLPSYMTRRLLLHSDTLPAATQQGFTRERLQPLIDQLTASDAGAAESSLGRAQGRSGRLYVSSRHIARHAPLTCKAIGTGPLFPQLSDSGHRRIAIVLPTAGLTPAVRQLLDLWSADGATVQRISLFSLGTQLPRVTGSAAALVENVTALAPWLDDAELATRGNAIGLQRWDTMTEEVLDRLAGLFAPFEEVISFDLQMFAPVMLKLRRLGVTTISCQPDDPPAAAGPGRKTAGLASRTWDDPVAALDCAGAYSRIVCTTQAQADLLSALGYPLSRIAIGLDKYLQIPLPRMVAVAE